MSMPSWIVIVFIIWAVIAVVTTILKRPVYGPVCAIRQGSRLVNEHRDRKAAQAGAPPR
jgi:hypothetical protein